jgi:L-ascorbate metabolism protein UlaG (beta-lactamase superfamily)
MNTRHIGSVGLVASMAGLFLVAIVYGQQQANPSMNDKEFEQDTISADGNDLKITFIGHGTLMFGYADRIVHVDPVSREADYSKLPKADLILITHEHGDHLDPKAVSLIRKEQTTILLPKSCADAIPGSTIMNNGEQRTAVGFKIEAVPAYNIVNKRPDGQAYHPKGNGNGYVVTFGKLRVYIAGDTENTPEMKALKNIDVAFLPMNLPYTMSPDMVTDAAKAFQPKILYPYHYGQTDPNTLVNLLRDSKSIEVRVRKMR